MTESFFDLKPGDRVISSNYYNREIVTVDRITKTQIIIGSCRFNRKTGDEISSVSFISKKSLQTATPELIAKIKAEQQIRKARNRAYALMEEFKKQCHYGDIIAALPHLKKAVDVLTSDQEAND